MRSIEKRYLMDLARDIVVAKLSVSSPSATTGDVGKSIAAMYESIYNKAKDIYFSDIEDSE